MSEVPHKRSVGFAVVVLIAILTTSVTAPLSSAEPNREDVAAAKDRLEELNGQLSVLDERLNLARLRLSQAQERLAQTRELAAQAEAHAKRALAELNGRAATAYQSVQSQWTSLFDAGSLAEFSDRVEFIGQIAQADSDLARTASNAEEVARRLAEALDATVEDRRTALLEIEQRRAQLQELAAKARTIYEDLEEEYRDALAAAEAVAEQRSDLGAPPDQIPVVNGSVDAVIAAARSVIGVPYVFGAADPDVGFDCSGLTMWAWAHAGVSLPHSSTMQYNSLPKVERGDLQPGDLIFSSYGRLGSGVVDHVALYIGGGQTIAATNPSSPAGYRSIDWERYVGAARPG